MAYQLCKGMRAGRVHVFIQQQIADINNEEYSFIFYIPEINQSIKFTLTCKFSVGKVCDSILESIYEILRVWLFEKVLVLSLIHHYLLP